VNQTIDTDTQLSEAQVDGFVANNGYLTAEVDGSTTNEIELPTGGSNGQVLKTDGSGNYAWVNQTVDTDTQLDSTGIANLGYIAGIHSNIQDTDGDTKIQMEETTDDDVIRFDLEGSEKWIMIGNRLEPRNTSKSLFIGEGAGANDDLTNNSVFIGDSAGTANITGYDNTSIGYQTLKSNTNGHDNVAVGNKTLFSNKTASYNVAYGNKALYSTIGGGDNTALGHQSMYSNTGGFANTALGSLSAYNNTTGFYNTALGNSALRSNTTGYYNSVVGTWALFKNIVGTSNTALGYQAGYNALGSGNIFIGYRAGYNETGGDKLYIDNSNTNSPLVYGDFSSDSLAINGNLSTTGSIHIGTSANNPGAALEVNSTTGAVLMPRMTTVQRDAIPNPTGGMMIFNTDSMKFQGYTQSIGSINPVIQATSSGVGLGSAGQSFTAGGSFSWTGLEIKGSSNSTQNGTLTIYENNHGGNVLLTQAISITPGVNVIEFMTPLFCVTGITYVFSTDVGLIYGNNTINGVSYSGSNVWGNDDLYFKVGQFVPGPSPWINMHD
jgi:hypothetical protein